MTTGAKDSATCPALDGTTRVTGVSSSGGTATLPTPPGGVPATWASADPPIKIMAAASVRRLSISENIRLLFACHLGSAGEATMNDVADNRGLCMMKLWHCADARSFRALWALEELQLPYELVLLPFPPRWAEPEYLKINPLGTIPYFEDGPAKMTESAAHRRISGDEVRRRHAGGDAGRGGLWRTGSTGCTMARRR